MGIKKDKSHLSTATELRHHAVEQLRAKTVELHPPLTEEARQRLDHELEVYQIEMEVQNAELRRAQEELETQQIELELQNEEMLRAQEELEISRNKYAELYDFAPVGYFTFDSHGVILEVNLTGALMLGIERRRLADKPFAGFIADADGEISFTVTSKLYCKEKGFRDVKSGSREKTAR